MENVFTETIPNNFWSNSEYEAKNFVEKPLTDEMITFTENKLGYKLPKAYIDLMRIQNGGTPIKNNYLNEYAKGREVNIIGQIVFFGIGSEKKYSLFGEFGNEFWFQEWEYPRDLGVIIAITESGGHDMIYLDYRECGRYGEPKVSVCCSEFDHKIKVLTNSFEDFISMLVTGQEVDNFLESWVRK